MSSRHLRKLQQQKELEEANKILQADQDAEEESDEQPEPTVSPKSKPAFSFAALEEEDEENSDGVADASEPEVAPVSKVKKPKNKKKKKGKSKGKGATKPEPKSDSEDIEAALRELNLKTTATTGADVAVLANDPQWERICALLAVQTHHLKVGNEMRTLFGRDATNNHDDAGGRARHTPQRAGQPMDLETALKGEHTRTGIGKGLPEITLRRNTLIQGKEDWPKGTTGGLSMELVDDAEGTMEFRYVHDKQYQLTQQEFFQYVEMGDPQMLITHLAKNPYHISSLIQVSKIAKDQGDHALSSDLLERALFTFGRAGLSHFNTKLSQGKARLDFQRPENREIWLAGYQYIRSLVMKGTYRTAFEWAKLLLSLDPEDDPYCMRLMIHYLALKSHQFSWLLEIGDLALDKGEIPIYNRDSYATYHNTPSLAFAALQLRDQVKTRDLLSIAMRRLPWLFVRLFQDLNLDAPSTIWGIQPRTDAEDLFTSIYLQQTKDLWNTPEATALLMEIAHTIPKVDATSIPMVGNSLITLEVARFVYLDNTPALMSLVPSAMLHKSNNSDCDPIPPEKSTFSYPAQRLILDRGSAQPYGWHGEFNPLAALHRLIPGFRGGPPGADDEDFDAEDFSDVDEIPADVLRRAMGIPSNEDLPDHGHVHIEMPPDIPQASIADRLLRMLWRNNPPEEEYEDERELTDAEDHDEMPGLVDQDSSDAEMPGLVNLDGDDGDSDTDSNSEGEMPDLVPA